MTTTSPAAGMLTLPAAGTTRCDFTDLPTEACAHCLPAPTPQPVSRAPRPSRAKLRPCGTQAAYKRHLSHGERPCDRCRAAHTQEDRRLRQTGTTVPLPASSPVPATLTQVERRAALTVVARACNADEARLLLDCLGLLGGAA